MTIAIDAGAARQLSGERNLSLDILKVVMAAMVVGLHGGFLSEEMPAVSHFLVQGVFRIAVPTFFIITGFYLERQLAVHGARWFQRIAVMLFLWTIAYSFAWFDAASLTMHTPWIDVVTGYYHLWYLFGLMGGAAVFLVVRRLTKSSAALLMIALLMFAFGVAIQYAGNWHMVEDPWWDRKLNGTKYYRNFLFFAFPFLVVGVLFSRHEKQLGKITPIVPILLPLAFAMLMTECGLNYYLNEPEGFDIYLSLILICPLLFLAARQWNVPGSGKAVALVATCIFLLHPMIQMQLDRHVELGGTARTLISLAIATVVAPVIIWMNRRLPLL